MGALSAGGQAAARGGFGVADAPERVARVLNGRGGCAMPIVHIYTAEGWLSPKRKERMIEKVTDAVVEAEGVPEARELTWVVIHEVPEGAFGIRGKVFTKDRFRERPPPEPEE
jgi:4-oxalocrotonate tautomerase